MIEIYAMLFSMTCIIGWLAWQIGNLNGRLDVHRRWIQEHRDYYHDKFGEYPE